MGSLELHKEDGGLRHLLDGKPVHAGEILELKRNRWPKK